MPRIFEVTNLIEQAAPLAYQESYDNCGLLVGDNNAEVNGILITLDVTEAVVDEAIQKKCNLIIAHHPFIFSGIKKITGRTAAERIALKSIQNQIAIYAAHTNIDNVPEGVSGRICQKLGLRSLRVLAPVNGELRKLVVFAPQSHATKVRQALFDAGAGHIGNYDQCSYNINGEGTFRALDGTNPFVGETGKLHFEAEVRIETIFPKHLISKITQALRESHPYEEIAFDIYPLENAHLSRGAGMVGELPEAMDEQEFLQLLKTTFGGIVRYSPLLGKPVKKVAVCGGSGAFLLPQAIAEHAQFYVTADVKYHQFFDADNKIVLADIGHYESEQFTKEIFYELCIKKISTFAVHLSETNTNSINYL
jgi:dinuclear metal center YbgI/SA1388 family protein